MLRSGGLACALGVGLTQAAVAGEVFAAGGLHGGPAQVTAACKIFNGGSTAVTLSGSKIVTEYGGAILLYPATCNGSLAPGRTCVIFGGITDNRSYACRVVASPSKAALRGILEMRDDQQHVLAGIDLR